MKMKTWLSVAVLALLSVACSSIDCPVQNRVYTVYQLMKADGTVDKLDLDTLTITSQRVNGTDTTLQNRLTDVSSFDLDISYTNPVDTLYMTLDDANGMTWRDTVWVAKENTPRFESVDCQMTYFHQITSVSATHHFIDSISIHHSSVNYDASNPHFYLYLKNRD